MNSSVKLDAQLKATILAAIRGGAFLHDAFRLAGVPDPTWRRWLSSTQTRGRLYEFQTEIKQAQAQARRLGRLTTSTPSNSFHKSDQIPLTAPPPVWCNTPLAPNCLFGPMAPRSSP